MFRLLATTSRALVSAVALRDGFAPARRAIAVPPLALSLALSPVPWSIAAPSLVVSPSALAMEPVREPTSSGQGSERGSGEGREPTVEAAPGVSSGETAARARLAAFTDDIDSFSARFEQTLYGADSEPLQSSSGTVVLKRPGRFVWDYVGGPDSDAQTIVADGERIWLYDRELAQVTVNAIDERVAGTPFVLLMGSAPLDDAYDVTALGASEGVEWLELVPKAAEGDFEALYIGLDERGLAALELRDNFGQATQILFEDFEANVAVDDATFVFEVPDGVDVIGLEGER